MVEKLLRAAQRMRESNMQILEQIWEPLSNKWHHPCQ